MSPKNILDKAKAMGLSIIGICDHNSTLQSKLIHDIGKEYGILALMGCELTSEEETHCLAFFERDEERLEFQKFIDSVLPNIPNDVDKFGYQIVVDRDENIVYEEDKILWSALPLNIDKLYTKVKEYNGIFIPAHVDKKTTSLMSQLGFVPPNILADALELTKFTPIDKFKRRFAYLKTYPFIKSSDAHFLDAIGESYTEFYIESLNFEEIVKALQAKEGRFIR